MKVLLDTNIVIHRETSRIVNEDIGQLFRWLDNLKYDKVLHPLTEAEINKYKDKAALKSFQVKLHAYSILQTTAPLHREVVDKIVPLDSTENDTNDTLLINEVYCDRVDLLITEDKNIHKKADLLSITDKVFTIDSFLRRVIIEHPAFVDYKVLSVKKTLFGKIDPTDSFFDSFRQDYPDFDNWFNRKSEEPAYAAFYKNKLGAFLYLKVEGLDESYSNIEPIFSPKKRLKIGTFKVAFNGVGLGERLLKIVFDNALQYKVDEVYVTIFHNHPGHSMLIRLLEDFGFKYWGIKHSAGGDELVYVRNFSRTADRLKPKFSFPFMSKDSPVYFVSIYPEYHTELFPDSILRTESPVNFSEDEPHRNVICKSYISHAIGRNIQTGDILIFYRTGGIHKGVVTTLAIVDSVIDNLQNFDQLRRACRGKTVLTDKKLTTFWERSPTNRPFVVNLLYAYSFPKRINLAKMIDLGIIAGVDGIPRGFGILSKEKFKLILQHTESDESIIGD